jgi:hypothetical protein
MSIADSSAARTETDTEGRAPVFVTTQWSVVLTAGHDTENAQAALEKLCRAYWYPLYSVSGWASTSSFLCRVMKSWRHGFPNRPSRPSPNTCPLTFPHDLPKDLFNQLFNELPS